MLVVWGGRAAGVAFHPALRGRIVLGWQLQTGLGHPKIDVSAMNPSFSNNFKPAGFLP